MFNLAFVIESFKSKFLFDISLCLLKRSIVSIPIGAIFHFYSHFHFTVIFNMKRSYLSGAQKRKNADKKKKKMEIELQKTRKLDEFVVQNPTTSSDRASCAEFEVSSNDAIVDDTEIQTDENESEICGTSTPELEVPNNITDFEIQMDENVSEICCASERMIIDDVNAPQQLIETQNSFSNDVGLWNVPDDLQALQRYWAKLGEFHSILFG